MTPMTVEEALRQVLEDPSHYYHSTNRVLANELMRPHQQLLRMMGAGRFPDIKIECAEDGWHLWANEIGPVEGVYEKGATLDEAAQQVLDELEVRDDR